MTCVEGKIKTLKIVQTVENNVEIIDHNFLISGHSFLPNDRDLRVVEMSL